MKVYCDEFGLQKLRLQPEGGQLALFGGQRLYEAVPPYRALVICCNDLDTQRIARQVVEASLVRERGRIKLTVTCILHGENISFTPVLSKLLWVNRFG